MNVRELKNRVADEAGIPYLSIGNYFYKLSPELGAFAERLNSIGGRNIKAIPPETIPDIDETVELEGAEAEALIAEFRALLVKVKK